MNKNPVLIGVLFLLVFVAGFILGRITEGDGVGSLNRLEIEGNTTTDQNGQGAAQNADTSTETNGATTVNTSSLTEGQRKMIQAMGIDPDTITITPEMIACAEAKLGAARIEEIKNGATPSFTEGATLMVCYK